ncbi:MAG TPA: pilus assembly protein TadG-related protein [Acidimicrobiales bacterium]|nr:pilus assembly protein TadG-related protein [Acidimicrobiales bacterium]
MNARSTTESGVVMVLVALLVVAMLAIVAIVIDGGQAYADRRRMQNAADAAAFAGARVLQQVRFESSTTDLAAAVRAVAADNDADADLVTCQVIDGTGSGVAPCSPNSGWASRREAAGVRVTAKVSRSTVFGRLAGVSEMSASASAAAVLHNLAAARSPWMVCGNPRLPGGFDLVDPATRALRPDAVLQKLYGERGSALPDARGIPIGGRTAATCGLSSSWNGIVDPASQPIRLGQFALADRGKQVGRYQYDDILAGVGGCPKNFADGEVTRCLALVPVFDEVDANAQSARIAAWAVWRIRYDRQGTVKYWGQFVSAGLARVGPASGEPLFGGSTLIVKLTE